MSNVRGQATGFNINSDEIIRNVSQLYITEPRKFALMSILHTMGMEYQFDGSMVNGISGNSIGVETVDNFKFETQLDELEDFKVTVNLAAGYAAGDTSIVVSDGSLVPKYALILIPRTGEIIRVTSVSTNTLTVARGVSGTTAAAILDGDLFIIMDSAYSEGDVSGDISFRNTTFDYNYTQISREQYGNSRTEQGTAKYGKTNSYDYKKKMALIKMLRRNNGTMWLGQRSTDSSNKFRTTGGVLSFVDSGNVYDAGGNLTQAEFEFFLQNYALAYNNNKKTLFASSQFINRMNSWASSKQIICTENNVLAKFGLSIKTYTTAWGEVDVVWEPYFDEISVGANPLSTSAVALDLGLIKLIYFKNGILHSRDDIQENDRDGRKGEWLMEFGAKVNVPKAHAILRNI